MKAYKYDKESKIYVGEVNCQKDPIASQKAGEDIWLLPANSTFDKPLDPKDGFNVVWNGGTWEYQEIPQPEPQPEPTQEEKEEMVRGVRDGYLSYWDFSQLRDAPFTEEEKDNLAEYRQYLRDYTKNENWWEADPATYEEWSTAHHPITEA